MLITLTRTGGFTGIPLKKTIDTSSLSVEKAKELESLVTQSQFFSLQQEAIAAQPAKPDRFSYTIAIQHDVQSHSLQFSESSITPEIQKLIEYIQFVHSS